MLHVKGLRLLRLCASVRRALTTAVAPRGPERISQILAGVVVRLPNFSERPLNFSGCPLNSSGMLIKF